MGYIDLMTSIQLEFAADYLVMAAMLAEIKSRMLLPRQPVEAADDEDHQAELSRRLQESERFTTAAADMDEIPRMGRDIHQARAEGPDREQARPHPDVDMRELLTALAEVLRRAEMFDSHQLELEKLSTRERMSLILENLHGQQFVPFVSLFKEAEGRLGVVVTFLAIMELIKEKLNKYE